MEHWAQIPSFEEYSVSDCGRVRKDTTGNIIAIRINSHGIPFAGLYKEGRQHQRTVSRLVIEAFMEQPNLEAFNTPINLDGDRRNNHICNLTLRPLWFARKYFQQFEAPPRGFSRPIEEVETKEYFKTSWEAATKYGLLDREIMLATLNNTCVWPTFQTFRVVGYLDYDELVTL